MCIFIVELIFTLMIYHANKSHWKKTLLRNFILWYWTGLNFRTRKSLFILTSICTPRMLFLSDLINLLIKRSLPCMAIYTWHCVFLNHWSWRPFCHKRRVVCLERYLNSVDALLLFYNLWGRVVFVHISGRICLPVAAAATSLGI